MADTFVYVPIQLIYLAGPITDVSYGGSTDWRKFVASKLPGFIKPVSPLRGKEYLSGEKKIAQSYEDIPLSSAKGIICRDRNDVKRCDLTFVNFLGADKVSIGSILEIALADAYRKPIVLAMDEANVNNHPMVREMAGYILPTLNEAIEIAVKVLSVGV